MKITENDIIYEDNHILVIKKPAGILSQEDSSKDPDILNLVKDYIRIRDHKPGQVFLGLVHRLDRNTGGLLCLAKTSKAAARLSEQIRQGKWKKRYLALSGGNDYLEDDGTWKTWKDYIAKDTDTNISTLVGVSGKPVTLRLRRLDQRQEDGVFYNCFEVDLGSGRSHQIRVQMAARNLPLLGDLKYHGMKPIGQDRYFLGLWAFGLEIEHPVKKSSMRFTVLPEAGTAWNLFRSTIHKAGDAFQSKTDMGQNAFEKTFEP